MKMRIKGKKVLPVSPDDVLYLFKTKAVRIPDNKEVVLQIEYKFLPSGDEFEHLFKIREIPLGGR